jgi:hypothetical protein
MLETILNALFPTLDTSIKLVTLVLDFLNALKTLLRITTRIYALFCSQLQQWQQQLSQILRNQLCYLNKYKFHYSHYPYPLYRSLERATRPVSN